MAFSSDNVSKYPCFSEWILSYAANAEEKYTEQYVSSRDWISLPELARTRYSGRRSCDRLWHGLSALRRP